MIRASPNRLHEGYFSVWTFALILPLSLALSAAGPAARAAPAPAEAKMTVERLLESTAVMGREGARPSDTGAVAARRAALATLDIDAISRFILGSHWQTLTPAQQKLFVATFTTVLERKALPKAGAFFEDVEIAFEESETVKEDVKVKTAVESAEEGRVEIIYVVHGNAKQARIQDVVLDGVSLRLNLRSQVQKVITDKGFDGLIKKMQEKLESVD